MDNSTTDEAQIDLGLDPHLVPTTTTTTRPSTTAKSTNNVMSVLPTTTTPTTTTSPLNPSPATTILSAPATEPLPTTVTVPIEPSVSVSISNPTNPTNPDMAVGLTAAPTAPTALMGTTLMPQDLRHFATHITDDSQLRVSAETQAEALCSQVEAHAQVQAAANVQNHQAAQAQAQVQAQAQAEAQAETQAEAEAQARARAQAQVEAVVPESQAQQQQFQEQLQQAHVQAQAQVQAQATAMASGQLTAEHIQQNAVQRAHVQAQAQAQTQAQHQQQSHPSTMIVPAPAHPYLPNDPTGRSVPANPYHPLIGHSYENISDARAALDAHAEASGYKLCVMKTLPAAVVWRCSQSGRRKTRARDSHTPPSKQRKHKLKERSGCRWKIRAVKRPRLVEDGNAPASVQWIWTIRESDNPEARCHNHDMLDPAAFASYRMKAAVAVKDVIFTMIDAGVKPVHIVSELKERARVLGRPDIATIKSRDIHNLVHARKVKGESNAANSLEGESNDIDLETALAGRPDDSMDEATDDDEPTLEHLGAAAAAMQQQVKAEQFQQAQQAQQQFQQQQMQQMKAEQEQQAQQQLHHMQQLGGMDVQVQVQDMQQQVQMAMGQMEGPE